MRKAVTRALEFKVRLMSDQGVTFTVYRKKLIVFVTDVNAFPHFWPQAVKATEIPLL